MKSVALDASPPRAETQESPVSSVFCLPIDRIGQRDESRVRDLQDAARRKDQFLAMLGHEMRNPLAPIRNVMQIFRLKGANDPEIQEMTAMVERQIEQLMRLVDDLVDVSRVGECGISLRIRTVDLKSVVALAVESCRPLIESRRHVLALSLPADPVPIEGDSGRLVQVVANLLNNSAKYSEDGGHIDLTLESIGDRAVLTVRDRGIGIEPAMLPKIFDLFLQVKPTASHTVDGLGIGLALVRNVVELHAGSVQAASAGLGRGTELIVNLPLLREPPAGNPSLPYESQPDANLSARRILIVDDNTDAADSLAILLRLSGHEVITAYEGQTALALAGIEAPDVVICDISMPGMGGYRARLPSSRGSRSSRLASDRALGIHPRRRSPALSSSRLQRPPHQTGMSRQSETTSG